MKLVLRCSIIVLVVLISNISLSSPVSSLLKTAKAVKAARQAEKAIKAAKAAKAMKNVRQTEKTSGVVPLAVSKALKTVYDVKTNKNPRIDHERKTASSDFRASPVMATNEELDNMECGLYIIGVVMLIIVGGMIACYVRQNRKGRRDGRA